MLLIYYILIFIYIKVVLYFQQSLGEAFAELGQKSPELQQEFVQNSETQKCLSKNGEHLLNALNFFVSSVNTLCNKTIEDTLITIKQYECARCLINTNYLYVFLLLLHRFLEIKNF